MPGSTAIKVIAAITAVIFISALSLMVYHSTGAALNWQMGDDDPILQFYTYNSSIYTVGATNISLIDNKGEITWQVPFPNIIFSSLGTDGSLYVYSSDRGLSRVLPDGTIASLSKLGINHPPLVDGDGNVYLRSWSMVTAIDASGNTLWNASNAISNPVIGVDGNVYFFLRPPENLSDVYLYCRGPDGSLKWSRLFDNYDPGMELAPAMNGGVLVHDEVQGDIFKVDAEGNIAWDYYKPYLGQYLMVEDAKARIFLFYPSGTVHVLNEKGELVNKFGTEDTYDTNITGMPAVYNDTIYLTAQGSSTDTIIVYALDLEGSTLWKRQINSSTAAQIYVEKNVLCIATEMPKSGQQVPVLYVLDKRGNIKYVYNSGDGREWGKVYIGADDSILAKTYGGMLYALKG